MSLDEKIAELQKKKKVLHEDVFHVYNDVYSTVIENNIRSMGTSYLGDDSFRFWALQEESLEFRPREYSIVFVPEKNAKDIRAGVYVTIEGRRPEKVMVFEAAGGRLVRYFPCNLDEKPKKEGTARVLDILVSGLCSVGESIDREIGQLDDLIARFSKIRMFLRI